MGKDVNNPLVSSTASLNPRNVFAVHCSWSTTKFEALIPIDVVKSSNTDWHCPKSREEEMATQMVSFLYFKNSTRAFLCPHN